MYPCFRCKAFEQQYLQQLLQQQQQQQVELLQNYSSSNTHNAITSAGPTATPTTSTAATTATSAATTTAPASAAVPHRQQFPIILGRPPELIDLDQRIESHSALRIAAGSVSKLLEPDPQPELAAVHEQER